MRILGWFGVLFVCFVSGGATCARRPAPLPFPPPPVVLNTTPTLAEVAAVVNRTANIRELSTNSASVEVLTMSGVPRLSATMNLQRERRFRLRASLPIILGTGLDVGSNDEMFWFEVPDGMSNVLYYARHDVYRQQLNRAVFPVDPSWFIDALGLVQIDPGTVVAGPELRPDGKYEVRSTIPTPSGIYQRVCFIEPQAGYVTDQLLYDPSGKKVAQCQATDHVYYEEQQCALPHLVEIRLWPAVGPELGMRIRVDNYTVNQLLSRDPQLFAMPTSASQAIDLTTVGPGGSPVAPPEPTQPYSYSASAETSNPIRGLR